MDRGQALGRIGQVIKDTYRLTRIIGKGGMGEVYEAEHVSLPRRFAVKFLLADLGLGAEVLARFHREASIAASVGSDHIVEVFDYGQSTDGSYFMVMEFLEGEPLSDRMTAHGAFTPEEWLPLFAQLADGLEAAHAAGVVHRDLKPDNVFLGHNKRGDEVLKILDFGISKIWGTGSQVTQAGAVMGTPSYMPPEQAEGSTAQTDARADIFSLGTIIYEVLSGRLAFEGPTLPATILKVCYQEPEPLETIAPHVSPAVIAVVMRALRKAPADRYQNVREFYDAFGAAIAAAPSPAMPHAPAAPHAPAVAPTVGAQSVPLAATVMGPGQAPGPDQAPGPGSSSTTLSASAAQLHTPALSTPVTSSSSSGRPVILIAIFALVIVGAIAGFLFLRGKGESQSSAGTTTSPTDAGAPPATDTPPVKRTSADASVPALSSDAAVTPRTPPRRVATPKRPRPRPRPVEPMRPMKRVVPRRRAARRRTSPRPRRRRTSKWAE